MITKAHTVPTPPPHTEPEPALITRAQQGDPEAFGELYRMHHHMITTFISNRVKSNPTLTEDLTADVFVKAWAKITTFTWTGTSIRAWLCTIARNTIADHYKIAATRKLTYVDHITHIGDTWTTPTNTAEDTALTTLAINDLHHALNDITPRQQAVIRLRFLADLTVTETAQTLGTTNAAVKTLQWRALDSLRKAYAATPA
ncbi:RNA polymerase sigma factor [Streptomyces chiangmaiensis]|uniref:Sigma-70 family RNA polymerase sigma factor n=1 Tax=Streptomyces chiangmaiensis TaxID=766497 RepID=A0ABU7FSN5_9ACTN|nr:sigma-70 family RNA polymerase sigma factor [Streptomyces chiangmaiensis]MED7827120.1 sigma-70 family RNA polymerase sigma factor [Streptomyces chiangmaiensis]